METDRGKGGVRWSETHRGGDGGWRGVRVREEWTRQGKDERTEVRKRENGEEGRKEGIKEGRN